MCALSSALREYLRHSPGYEGDLQDTGAGGADEGAVGHVGVGRAALVAVKALSVGGQTRHFPEHLQVFLLLLSLRTRRHGRSRKSLICRSEGEKTNQTTFSPLKRKKIKSREFPQMFERRMRRRTDRQAQGVRQKQDFTPRPPHGLQETHSAR